MHDLSLHLLNVLENALRAGATRIRVDLAETPSADRLELRVEDNGPGLAVDAATAMDPFYTTKPQASVGLGLALLRDATERSGGALRLDPSSLGGLAVTAVFRHSHPDAPPLGDIPSTLAAAIALRPDVEFELRLVRDERACIVRTDRAREERPSTGMTRAALARDFAEAVRQGIADVRLVA